MVIADANGLSQLVKMESVYKAKWRDLIVNAGHDGGTDSGTYEHLRYNVAKTQRDIGDYMKG